MNNPEQKFSKIYDQHIEKIYRFVFLKVSSKEIAEDISSRVFMKGWEVFRNGADKIENPKAFLYQIARNMVIDHYREKGKTKIVSADFCSQIADPKTNIQEKAIINADLEKVKIALTGLSDDYQNVVIWHYLDDLSIKEVSKLLDRSEDATRVLLHRALNSLREHLTS
ncbi:RNA polymerase sigma factor [Patescibacteria group bacterium]|nr:RNA polymerase sigma factor [Patescibacteria group bacterium]